MTSYSLTRTGPYCTQWRFAFRAGSIRYLSAPFIALVTCLLILIQPPELLADTHYVSKTGSNTFPYDSWATATDSILLAVDAAAEWDTVLLAAGEYTADTIGLKKGLAFIGAGRDSTLIIHNGNTAQCIYLVDSCLLQGIHLKGTTDTAVSGTVTFHLLEGVLALEDQSAVVRGCRFSDIDRAFQALWTDLVNPSKRVVLEDNEFTNFFSAVRYWFCSSRILGNSFCVNYNDIGNSIKCWYNTAEVRGNTFIRTVPISFPAIELGHCDSIWVANNICIATLESGEAMRINGEFSGYPTQGVIDNNLCIGGWGGILVNGGNVRIRNNIVERSTTAALYYDTLVTTPGNVGYNLFWENEHRSSGDLAFRPDPGNLFANPMFVDSLDFHLQAFSPAIDAGDASLLDADGSRSDIGPFGGPYGQAYVYLDLAPAQPIGLAAQWQDSGAAVWWVRSSETDLAGYRLYRDSFPIIAPDPLLLLSQSTPGDTTFFDTSDLQGKTMYYRLTALDAQDHESSLGNEVVLSVSSIPGEDDGVLPQEFVLYPNYPNPFNASTLVSFSLPRPATATVSVYDVLGRRVRTLADQAFAAGKHSLRWEGTDDQNRAVASGVYFIVFHGGPDSKVQKSVLLK